MDEYNSELTSFEFAGWWMERLRESLEMAREKARLDPEGARCLLGPASQLASELVATQAAVDELSEQIQSPVELPAQAS